MKLVDFDVEIMEYLVEHGYTHAVLKPLLFQGETQLIDNQRAMELVPFKELDEAQHYLDYVEDEALMQSTIIEMSIGPEEVHVSGIDSAHLLIDAETINMAA